MVNNITIINTSWLWMLAATHSIPCCPFKHQVNLTCLELVVTCCSCSYCTIMKGWVNYSKKKKGGVCILQTKLIISLIVNFEKELVKLLLSSFLG